MSDQARMRPPILVAALAFVTDLDTKPDVSGKDEIESAPTSGGRNDNASCHFAAKFACPLEAGKLAPPYQCRR